MAELARPAITLALPTADMIQGVPMGLVFGTVPFLLKASSASYADLGFFSLASYPYSLKLLWSPIVDSHYWPGPPGSS